MSVSIAKTAFIILLLLFLTVNVQAVIPPGDIVVHSAPSGAFACIDTVDCNYTTATFTAAADAWHTVTVTKDGYMQWSNTVYVTSGQTSTVVADLQLNPDATRIQVSVNPGGGKVCLDNTGCQVNVGNSGGIGTTLFTGVNVGPHIISVQTDGFRTFTEQVYVSLGATSSISIDLVPIPTTTGSIQVSVNPAGGQVCLDNGQCRVAVGIPASTGNTLFTDVSVGSHVVSAQADGFRTYTGQVYVSSGSTSTTYINLVSVSAPAGNIQVVSTPDRATACVDGGNCLVTPGTFSGLNPGMYHMVTFSLPGYGTHSENAYVVADQTTLVQADLPSAMATGTLRVSVSNAGSSTVCIDTTNCRQSVGGTNGDVSGTTDFTGVTANNPHTLTVSSGGYELYTAQVTISKNQVNTINITLRPSVTTTVPTPLSTPLPATPTPTPFSTSAGSGPLLPVIGLALCGAAILLRSRE